MLQNSVMLLLGGLQRTGVERRLVFKNQVVAKGMIDGGWIDDRDATVWRLVAEQGVDVLPMRARVCRWRNMTGEWGASDEVCERRLMPDSLVWFP